MKGLILAVVMSLPCAAHQNPGPTGVGSLESIEARLSGLEAAWRDMGVSQGGDAVLVRGRLESAKSSVREFARCIRDLNRIMDENDQHGHFDGAYGPATERWAQCRKVGEGHELAALPASLAAQAVFYLAGAYRDEARLSAVRAAAEATEPLSAAGAPVVEALREDFLEGERARRARVRDFLSRTRSSMVRAGARGERWRTSFAALDEADAFFSRDVD